LQVGPSLCFHYQVDGIDERPCIEKKQQKKKKRQQLLKNS